MSYRLLCTNGGGGLFSISGSSSSTCETFQIFITLLIKFCGFYSLFVESQSHQRDFKIRKLSLAVITKEYNEADHILQQMYQLAWQHGILNFNVLLSHDLQWSIVTYLPFRNNCITLESRTISIFTQSNYTLDMNIAIDQLYPVKNRNFNNCTISVATYHVEPYVFISHGREGVTFDGIEVAVINTIAKAINLNVIYINVGSRGDVYDNGTLTGSVEWVSLTREKHSSSSSAFV